MPDAYLIIAFVGVFFIAYGLGNARGKARGQVEAIESLHDIDLSRNRGEDSGDE